MLVNKQGTPVTDEKALAMALLAKAELLKEVPSDTARSIGSANGVLLSGRSLMHRYPIESGSTGGIIELIDSSTARVVGVSDFNKQEPADGGLWLLTHISVATTGIVGSKDNTSISVANFKRAIKTDDAFLLSANLKVKVDGVQPPLILRLGDVMVGANDNESGSYRFKLPEGIYITKEQKITMQLELPKGANGIAETNFKCIEIVFHGMHAAI